MTSKRLIVFLFLLVTLRTYADDTLTLFSPNHNIRLTVNRQSDGQLKYEVYYKQKYAETRILRASLKQNLQKLGVREIIDGVANYLLFYLPEHFPQIDEFVECCKQKNLFLRDVSNMGKSIGKNAVRIAVKDDATNNRMIGIIKQSLLELVN